MKLHLIFARAANGVIGIGNRLPWQLPEDLAHFKRCTLGCPVLMGRRTWDSLPAKFRPLPGRTNIVLTHQPDWYENGAQRASSLPEALQICEHFEDLWVIGGAQLYAQALPLACHAVVTEIGLPFDGDVFAPPFPPAWQERSRQPHISANGLPFAFVSYVNTGLADGAA